METQMIILEKDFHGLKKYFKCIIDSETVGVKKPHSKIFNTAFNRSGAKKLEECIIIGDNFEADVLGGLNNGFNAIHLNTNKQPIHKRCIIIEDLITLTEIL